MRMLKMVSRKDELPWAIAIQIPNKTKSKEDEAKSKAMQLASNSRITN